MTGPRIFVCYREEVQRDHFFAQQLIDDLHNAGNDIATLENIEINIDDEQFDDALHQELLTCEWVLLVLTPEALQSSKIGMVVNTALTCIMQKKIRNLFAMLAAPVEQQDMPPTWTTIRRFDATQDYPRALARLLLTLHPTDATTTYDAQVYNAPSPSLHPVPPSIESQPTRPLLFTDGKPLSLTHGKPPSLLKSTAAQQNTQRWFVPLIIFFILILIVSLIYSIRAFSTQSISPHPLSASTVSPSPTMKPSPTINATTTALFANPQRLYEQIIQSKPLLSDPLKDATLNNWMVGTHPNGGCAFVNGAYDVTSLQLNNRQLCLIKGVMFHNIAFQAQMSFVADGNNGSPCGLIVRMQKQVMASFRFNLYASGHYELIGADLGNGKVNSLGNGNIAFTPHQPVTLAVIMRNSQFYVYANGKFVTSATDPTYSKGRIGFVCRDKGTPVEAVFSNAQVWNI